MKGREIIDRFRREHHELRERLRECAAAQNQASDGSYGQCLQAVGVLRELCRLLEHEVAHHFCEEETALYALAKVRLPALAPVVVESEEEHEVIRQTFEEFRRELHHFNTSGETRQLPRLGRELINHLRQHMDREESILYPAILRDFADDDWRELARLFTGAKAA